MSLTYDTAMQSMPSGVAPPLSHLVPLNCFWIAANGPVLLSGVSLMYVSACLQGACVSGSKTMLVMEFVEGGDLWRNLQRPGTRVGNWRLHGRKVALDIARGLCFLHAHSIV